MPEPISTEGALPSITALFYGNGVITAFLDIIPHQTVTAGFFQGQVSGAPINSGTSNTGVVRITINASQLNPTRTYYVALTFEPDSGPWGMPATLVWQEPAFTAIIATPELVEVAWSLPATTTINAVRATLSAGSIAVVTGTYTGSGTRFVPPVPLTPSAIYLINAAGVNGVSQGPNVTSPPLILTSPTVTSVSYTAASGGGSFTITAGVGGTAPSGATVTGRLLRDGVVFAQQNAAGTTVTFTVTAPLDPRSKWQVALFNQSGIVSGPLSPPFSVDTPAVPAITALFYGSSTVTAFLATPPVPSATVALFKGPPSGTAWVGSKLITGTSASIPVTGTLDPTFAYTVALSLDTTATPVVWGPPVTLVWQQPALAALQVTSASVNVSWTLPAATTIAAVEATLFDQTHAAAIVTGTFGAGGGQLVPPVPLDPTATYVVKAVGRAGIARGPSLTSPSLIVTSPTVASIAYAPGATAGTFTLTVNPQSVSTPPGSVTGRLLREGAVVAQQAATGGSVVFTLAQPLDPAADWQVVLFYQSGIATGPTGVPYDVSVPRVPAITSMFYNASGIIVAFFAAAPVPQATIAVFKGSPAGTGWLVSKTTTGLSAMLQITPSSLEPQFEYTVALSLDTTATPVVWGPPATLVWQQPAFAAVSLSANTVNASWTLPVTTTIAAVLATLTDSTANLAVASGTFAGSGAQLTAPAPLDPAHTYTLSILGVNGISKGPTVTLEANLILTAPAVAAAVYSSPTSGAYQIVVTPATAGTPPGSVVGQLWSGGTLAATQPASGATVTFPLTAPLNAAMDWQVALFFKSGIVSGPSGAPVALPLIGPSLASALYDGSNFYLTWSGGATSGAAVAILRTDNNTTAGSATVASGSSAIVTPSAAIDPTKPYAVTFAPIAGSAQGLPGPPSPLIVLSPSLVSVSSDGEQVAVTLSGTDPNATATELLVTNSSGALLLAAPAGLAGGYVALPPAGLAGIKIAARSVSALLTGPQSGGGTSVIVAAPSIANVAFTGSAVTGTATAPAGVPLTGPVISVSLYADGILAAGPVQAASNGTFSLPTSGTNGASLTLQASVAGTAGGVAVAGPLSSPVPVLTGAPVIATALLAQSGTTTWQISAQWMAPPGEAVTVYNVALVQAGATLRTWPITGTSLADVAAAFDATKALTLVVTPAGNYGNGPSSAAATFLPAASSAVSVLVDGGFATATWTANTTAGTATAYRLRLVQAVTAGQWITIAASAPAAGTTAAVPLPSATFAPAAVFGVAVDAASGNAWVSSLAVTPIVMQTPVVTSIVGASAGTATITWTWPGGAPATPALTAYTIVAIQGSAEVSVGTQTAPATSATVRAPAAGSLLAVRPVAGNAVGPRSLGGAAIVAQPVVVSTTASDQALAVEFTAVGPPAAAHLVTIAAGGTPLAQAWASSSPATVPFEGAVSGTAYTVSVTAVTADFLSQGPPSSPAEVILLRPVLATPVASGSTLSVTATEPDAGITVTSYDLQLLLDGVVVQSVPGAAPVSGVLTITVAQTVDPAGSYTLSAVPVAGTSAGPPAAIPVLLASPVISAAAASTTSGATSITVFANNGAMTGSGLSLEAMLDADGTPGTPVAVSGGQAVLPVPSGTVSAVAVVRAKSGTATGPWSPGTPVPVHAPVVAAVATAQTIAVTWSGNTASSYLVELMNGTAIVAETAGQGLSATLPLPGDPAAASILRVTESAGVATGPAGTLALVTAGATITAATVTGTRSVAVQWTAPAAPATGITGYQPVILSNGALTPLALLPASPTQATIAIPAAIPGGASLAMLAIAGTASGPPGNDVPLLFQAPLDVFVSYDGSSVFASWTPAADPRADSYVVTFSASGAEPVVETVSATTWQTVFTPAVGQTASVTVAMAGGPAVGPASSPVNAILHAPLVTSGSFDGTNLTLGWSPIADAAATSALVTLLTNGVATRQIVAGGLSTTIPYAVGPFTLTVQGAGRATLGPAGPKPFTPITGAPSITSIGFAAGDGSLTIAWSAVPGAPVFNVFFRNATGTPLQKQVTTNSLTLTASQLPPAGVYTVSVQPLGSANGAISGPFSAAVPLVAIAPPSVSAAYDGRQAVLSWDPIPSPEVIGYQATLLVGTTAVTSASTSSTTVSLAAAYDATKNYQVVVQALTGAGAGLPSSPVTLFNSGWYPSVSASQSPYLAPANGPSMSPFDIVVYLPNLFATLVTSGLPSTSPFALATTPSAPFVYTLTMAGDSIVWTFDANAIRPAVRTAYTTLLGKLKPLGLTPLGWNIVQDAISRAMPQTFAESLFYGYGFLSGSAGGYIDLKPGMILRAEYEGFQYLGPDAGMPLFVDGYVASNTAEYEIGSYLAGSTWLTGLDAFLSLMTQQGTIVPPPPNDGSNFSGGGGIADLYYAQIRLPFLRLVYPPALLGSGASDPRPAFNVAVLAATDYATLNTATLNLRNALPVGPGAAVTYLRGRTVMSACIRVWVDEIPMVVPVGTTAGNLLESMASRPPIFPVLTDTAPPPPGIPLSGLTLTRATGCAVTSASAGTNGYAVGTGVPVMLSWNQGMAYSATADWLSLPLLPGDRLSTKGTG